MATNLQFIKSGTVTGATSLSITDCFSATYDVYKIVISKFDIETTANKDLEMRFLDSASSPISASNYANAIHILTSYSTFSEGRQNNTTRISGIGRDEQATGNGTVLYAFNPYSSSSYSYTLSQGNGFVTGSGLVGYKNIGVLKQTATMTGIQLFATSQTENVNIECSVYGVK